MIIHGDATQIPLADNSVDTCITDPPYGLGFMGKEWDTFDKSQFGIAGNEGENDLKVKKNFKVLPRYNNGGDLYNFTLQWATEVYRVLKPGALLLSFGGTRTYHRMVCAIEDAGFEIRDTIAWVYGSGFPKSYNIGKGIDKQAGAEREFVCESPFKASAEAELRTKGKCQSGRTTHNPITKGNSGWDGWGTALKPAMELIVVAMKPLDGTFAENALKWGVAGYWIDGGRVGDFESNQPSGLQRYREWSDSHTGQNRPPMEATTSGSQGRFPANLIHDGSDEVTGLFPMTGASKASYRGLEHSGRHGGLADLGGNIKDGTNTIRGHDDNGGSAARFFYCAKASRSERNAGLEEIEPRLGGSLEGGNDKRNGKNKPQLSMRQNHHPTVKPIALMRYLARLTKTPTGGVVLDPFMGSGTTGIACVLEGREFIGIEREPEYVEIAEKRIAHYRLPIMDEVGA